MGNFLNFAVNISTHYEYDIKLLNSVSALLKLPLQTVIPKTGKVEILLIWMGNFFNFAVNISTHYEYDIKLLNSVCALL